ncbi:MAG: formylglycine-generating enzyme family protein [Verrucomicrobia bacterium]|nr:formylglycine-generating enzyme family protein [Verrucomicrobiota bacterium]
MNTSKLVTGFMSLALLAAMAQADGSANKNFTIPISNTINLDMIWIEPGTFMMGSPEDEIGRMDWGEDLHEVTLPSGFWMGKYEVTQAQYMAIMGDNPSNIIEKDGRHYGIGSNYPVYYMTWKEATNFCAKLTEIERAAGRLPKGYEYTLPTSEQWEYACRAGTTTAFNNGTNIAKKSESEYETCPNLEPLAWYMSNSDRQTHPVGQKQPNAWGLYDMHGNVDEACIDELYSGVYICRGGWFGMGAMYARSAYRLGTDTNERSVGTGFRLALVNNQPVEPPKIEYTISKDELTLTFTGVLYKSDDAVNWTKVESASSPYKVAIGDRKQFFCFKEESSGNPDDPPVVVVTPGTNATIPLSDAANLEMNWIEPGTFMMGSPKNELGRENKETQHQVTLTKGYWMGKYEVTQAQYKAVTGTNPSWDKGADLPVEQVSWYDAMEFCSKLTDIEREAGRLPEGYEYTLPTEAQWEYACRAGTTTALNSGKNLSKEVQCSEMDEVGWYWYNGGKESYNNNLICTHPGGQKKPNAWGLYDMHGNVGEWCLDYYEDYPTSAVVDPTGPDTGTDRAVRWGSWWNAAWACRSAYRGNDKPDAVYASLGFRVALAPVVTSNDIGLDMVWIEPGTFMMGSPENEQGRANNETQHKVTLTQGYWLGKYEVTQKQYQAIMGKNPSNFKGATLPVEKVSWEDAMAFCAKLTASEKEAGRLPSGYEYTLPTEAQWEYACRAGTTTALNSGKDLTNGTQCSEMGEVGWYSYNSGEKTHPVGQKKPNAWGLYDMHGNVLEWCLDWNGDYPLAPVTDPTGPDNGTSRVIRGGGWNFIAGGCRSASRSNYGPTYNSYFCGFRVALSSVQVVSKDIKVPLSETVNLDMIWIEKGTFIMGSPKGEMGRDNNDEENRHQVTLTQDYWIGKYEVTQAQYKAIMGTNPSRAKGDEKPVHQVTWDDAMEFCAKLTEIEKAAGRLPEGYVYTLPTEAQWEYACRAGTTTALNSGKNLSNASKCSEMEEVGWYYYANIGMVSVVGQKLPNAWGLYDMHGNVKEWCLDWYKENYYQGSPSEDPTGPAAPSDYNNYKVVRGGGWATYAYDCRSASRGKYYVDRYDRYTGFRVALVPEK